jgi:hypothetical protein
MKPTSLLCSVLIATVIVGELTPSAFPGSLAGSAGEERRKVRFAYGTTGGCKSGYEKYVAASGHSAYAATPDGWRAEHIVCGWTMNAPSKAAAEKQALKTCNEGLRKYKVKTIPLCELAASK